MLHHQRRCVYPKNENLKLVYVRVHFLTCFYTTVGMVDIPVQLRLLPRQPRMPLRHKLTKSKQLKPFWIDVMKFRFLLVLSMRLFEFMRWRCYSEEEKFISSFIRRFLEAFVFPFPHVLLAQYHFTW